VRYYIWIISADNEKYFLSHEMISNNYLVPDLDIQEPKYLAGSDLFVVLRGNKGDILFKKINILKVEEYLENGSGIPHGFLLTINILKSFAIVNNYSNGLNDFLTSSFINYDIGLREITPDEAISISDYILSQIAFRIKRLENHELLIDTKNLNDEIEPFNFAAQLLKEVIKKYTLASVWSSEEYQNPFLNFSFYFLRNSTNRNYPLIMEYLDNLTSQMFKNTEEGMHQRFAPIVDIDFRPIDVLKIYSRKFHAIDKAFNISSIMLKTEDAEKRHQDILRDIVNFLVENKLEPVQTNSIDFALITNNITIFEIKTTNHDNVLAQIAKGVFQLVLYSQAIIDAGLKKPRKILILESTTTNEYFEYIKKVFVSLEIELVLYDRNKSWPDKLGHNLSLFGISEGEFEKTCENRKA